MDLGNVTRLLSFAVALAMIGCDGEPEEMDGGADSGAMDAGRADSGSTPADPCRADSSNAVSTLGCNGGLYGSTQRPNQIDGPCTPDGNDPPGPGSCMPAADGAEAICVAADDDPSTGTCLYACERATSYVSTGGCPEGSRCFRLSEVSICFRDCNSASDCFEGEECDSEGSCVVPPPPDAGVADGGVSDAGVSDGGAVDAGLTDGAVGDGGVAGDAAVTDAGATADAAIEDAGVLLPLPDGSP